ncbi:MAG: TolB family protein [Dehalococcoidia bacterium]
MVLKIRAVVIVLLVALAAGCSVPGGRGGGGDGGDAPANFAFVGLQGSTRHIYLMNVDASGIGSNSTRLTADTGSEYDVFWSPDGKRFVYARDFNGAAIYVINADGTGEQRLSPTPGFDTTPAWSPDGTKIVYVRLLQPPQPNAPPPMTDIRIMNADGTGDRTILANTSFSVEPQWSVNNRIVFMSLMNGSKLDIYTMNTDGTGLLRLTDNGANNAEPAWSPDGAKMSFGSDREGGDNVNIYTMDADGGNVVQLTHFDFPEQASDTNWSSDGKKIAFEYDLGGQKQDLPTAHAEVWTMNADGSGEHTTMVQCSDSGCNPRWQPK